jgi:3-oxoacyl-[acyl-carrier-protein] synthase-3
VKHRHLSAGKLCSSDLCFAAAKRLLGELKWEPSSVEVVIFVSQTFDFSLPASSCILQDRLGLSRDCAAFDIELGCSGYVYALWMASSLLAGSGIKRALVLAGDTLNHFISPQDRSTALLFGDAGTATALEWDEAAPPMSFCLGTDGSGWKNLIVPTGMCRWRRDSATNVRQLAEGKNVRSAEDLFMDGAEVFAFTLREVPPLIANVLNTSGWASAEVDHFVFHQANRFMLGFLGKTMKLPADKIPLSLEQYGNTSCASIPLTINAALAKSITQKSLKLILAGFGVGYSWGACALHCGPIVSPEVIQVEESEAWQ